MAMPSNIPEPTSDVKIEEQALSVLIDSLSRLKKAGGRLKRDEIWGKPLGRSPLSSLETTMGTLYADIANLQSLKRVKSALYTLAESVEAAVIARREEILPISRHFGLLSLPTDIVFYIFQKLLDSYEDTYEDPFRGARTVIRDLSLVNRQFRRMLIEFTGVWAFLDLDCCKGEVLERHLRRSKQAPLSIRLEYIPKMQSDISIAMLHKDRWKYLDVTFLATYTHNDMDARRREEEAIINLPSVDFPSIRSLRHYVDYDNFYDNSKELGRIIFSRWTFPNVEVVKMLDDIPDADCFKYNAVISFRYNGGPYGLALSGFFLKQLTGFLKPAVNLQTVYLDFSSHIFESNEHGGFLEVELPNVTDFTITTWSKYIDFDIDFVGRPLKLDDFAQRMRAFRMPNVKNITVSIAFFEDELDLEDWVPLAFPNTHNMGSVSRLSFNVKRYPWNENMYCLMLEAEELLRRFPALEAFSIDAGDCEIIIDCEDQLLDLHNLQTLQIDNCSNSPDEFYWMLRRMADAGAAPNELKINSKFALNLERLENIFLCADIQVTSPY